MKITFTINKQEEVKNIIQSSHANFNINDGGDSAIFVGSKKINITNQRYNVPSDSSCLFYSVAKTYLFPARNNNEKFKSRFIKLFGEENLKYLKLIKKLLKEYGLENNRNLNQLWYQN